MPSEVYRQLRTSLAKYGDWFAPRDIPEFYALAEELLTPEEAAVASAMPRKPATLESIAREMGRGEAELRDALEKMADKGLVVSVDVGRIRVYSGISLGRMLDFAFLPGTRSERDRKLARLAHAYKAALHARYGPPKIGYPVTRVIPIDKTIQTGNTVRTYDQVMSYLDNADSISVATCYCRHEALLADETDVCGAPNDVCMQFGWAAEFVVDRGIGRRVGADEAREILRRANRAGLVHCTQNKEAIDFVCSCCVDHCVLLKTALAQPKPGLAMSSGFLSVFDPDVCPGCGEKPCVDACPAAARVARSGESLRVDADRCIGCGLCVTRCPTQTIRLIPRPDHTPPPPDDQALGAALKAYAQSRAGQG